MFFFHERPLLLNLGPASRTAARAMDLVIYLLGFIAFAIVWGKMGWPLWALVIVFVGWLTPLRTLAAIVLFASFILAWFTVPWEWPMLVVGVLVLQGLRNMVLAAMYREVIRRHMRTVG